jgi:hypothetical protein
MRPLEHEGKVDNVITTKDLGQIIRIKVSTLPIYYRLDLLSKAMNW